MPTSAPPYPAEFRQQIIEVPGTGKAQGTSAANTHPRPGTTAGTIKKPRRRVAGLQVLADLQSKRADGS